MCLGSGRVCALCPVHAWRIAAGYARSLPNPAICVRPPPDRAATVSPKNFVHLAAGPGACSLRAGPLLQAASMRWRNSFDLAACGRLTRQERTWRQGAEGAVPVASVRGCHAWGLSAGGQGPKLGTVLGCGGAGMLAGGARSQGRPSQATNSAVRRHPRLPTWRGCLWAWSPTERVASPRCALGPSTSKGGAAVAGPRPPPLGRGPSGEGRDSRLLLSGSGPWPQPTTRDFRLPCAGRSPVPPWRHSRLIGRFIYGIPALWRVPQRAPLVPSPSRPRPAASATAPT